MTDIFGEIDHESTQAMADISSDFYNSSQQAACGQNYSQKDEFSIFEKFHTKKIHVNDIEDNCGEIIELHPEPQVQENSSFEEQKKPSSQEFTYKKMNIEYIDNNEIDYRIDLLILDLETTKYVRKNLLESYDNDANQFIFKGGELSKNFDFVVKNFNNHDFDANYYTLDNFVARYNIYKDYQPDIIILFNEYDPLLYEVKALRTC